MKRKSVASFSLIVLALIVSTYNACTDRSSKFRVSTHGITSIGNPLTSSQILAALCGVINRCRSEVSISNCRAGVLAEGGIDYQLGLPKGSYATFSSIVQAEQAGALFASGPAADSCESAINSLSCSDPSVLGAYDPASSDPFGGVPDMIPTSPGACPAVFSTPPGNNDYFVSGSGSDVTGDGSNAKPWATISYAAQNLIVGSGGATVHVAPGTYAPVANICPQAGVNCGVYTIRSGTSSARIVYISDRQWGARIVPSGSDAVWYNSGDYVDIVGFEMVGDSTTNNGIHNDGSNVRIIGNHVHHIPVTVGCAAGYGGGGIAHYNYAAHDNDTIGNLVHDVGPQMSDGLPSTSYCSKGEGIGYQNPRGHIQNNIVYEISNYGIESWHAASGLKISNNLIYNSGVATNQGYIGGGILIGAGDLTGALNDNTTVSNNIIRNNRGSAITEFGSTGAQNMYLNNVIFSNKYGVFLKNGLVPTGTISSDPQMVDFQVDGSGDDHLQSSSPAIDAGVLNCADLGGDCVPSTDMGGFARPYGSAIDVGPFEWRP